MFLPYIVATKHIVQDGEHIANSLWQLLCLQAQSRDGISV
jgi:hypothetical protein